jgi:hypothetical protein
MNFVLRKFERHQVDILASIGQSEVKYRVDLFPARRAPRIHIACQGTMFEWDIGSGRIDRDPILQSQIFAQILAN